MRSSLSHRSNEYPCVTYYVVFVCSIVFLPLNQSLAHAMCLSQYSSLSLFLQKFPNLSCARTKRRTIHNHTQHTAYIESIFMLFDYIEKCHANVCSRKIFHFLSLSFLPVWAYVCVFLRWFLRSFIRFFPFWSKVTKERKRVEIIFIPSERDCAHTIREFIQCAKVQN